MKHIIHPVYYLDFLLAGKPRYQNEFSLENTQSGNEVILVIQRGADEPVWWVKTRMREWIGKIVPVPHTDQYVFERRQQGLNDFQFKDQQVFNWFFSNLVRGTLPPFVQLKYHGRCAHCHRELTDPDSIPIGIGPDCFKKLGLTYKSTVPESVDL